MYYHPSLINATNSLHIQAGKNISFNNTQLAKTNKLTLSANDNIVIHRDESNLMKLAASEPAANINTHLSAHFLHPGAGFSLFQDKRYRFFGITCLFHVR